MNRGRPKKLPIQGDVEAAAIARLLGLDLETFAGLRPELEFRGFPLPDPTTARYCLEAVQRWRLLRHAALFPEIDRPQSGALPNLAASGHAPNPLDH
jgi:hypothetical protein